MGGPEHSTLSNDAFPTRGLDFMLSNPPYGKSWKTDVERRRASELRVPLREERVDCSVHPERIESGRRG